MRILSALIVAAALTASAQDTPGSIQPGTFDLAMKHAGRDRTYRLYVPKTYAGKPLPLMIALHGAGSNAAQTEWLTGFNGLADAKGFVVAYPNGLDSVWRYTDVFDGGVDDLGFVVSLVDKLIRENIADAGRLYVTGISNGAYMANMLGAVYASKFAAIAPVAGTFLWYEDRKPSRAVPVIYFHGTQDAYVRYNGTDFLTGLKMSLSAEELAAWWAAKNGCDAASNPTIELLPDLNAQDGTRVKRYSYGRSKDGARVEFYRIEGGGHTWPGGSPIQEWFLLGKVTQDISASALIWDFCSRYSLASQDPGAPKTYTVTSLKKSVPQGIKVFAPDGKTFALNQEDEKGIGQIYIGSLGSTQLKCITNVQKLGGPKPDRYKTQPSWHPSGKWLFVSVERDQYDTPPIVGGSREYVEGMIRCGLYVNLWALTPDGETWVRMTDFKEGAWGVPTPTGLTGPVFTPDGKNAVWSQIVDGNIFAYIFGRWELMRFDFAEEGGKPVFKNPKNITPQGMHWNEPGNFAPDNTSLLFTGSDQKDANGMDQFLLNIFTGELKNLTNSPTVWDEHGRFSPDGEKIIFMSAHPYRDDPNASKILSIKTEFMMMNRDGSGLVQLTHFKTPGYPESSVGIAANPEWNPDGRSAQLRQLVFPNYVDWTIQFDVSK